MRLHLPQARPLPLLPWDPSKEGWQGQSAERVAGALAGWAPGFQLQLWGRGRAGILPKACAPSSLGTQLQRPAHYQTQTQKRASGGREGQERRIRER